MKNISEIEKDKLLQLLECSEKELDFLIKKSGDILQEGDNVYDILLKILQQGFNLREAILSGITLGKRLGYKKAKTEIEEEIKEKLYRAFKNSQ